MGSDELSSLIMESDDCSSSDCDVGGDPVNIPCKKNFHAREALRIMRSPSKFLLFFLFFLTKNPFFVTNKKKIKTEGKKCRARNSLQGPAATPGEQREKLYSQKLPIKAAKLNDLRHLSQFLEKEESRKFYQDLTGTQMEDADNADDEENLSDADSYP